MFYFCLFLRQVVCVKRGHHMGFVAELAVGSAEKKFYSEAAGEIIYAAGLCPRWGHMA